MSGLDGSQCGTSYAFVSWIIKDSMIVVERLGQPYSHYNRPEAGHCGLSAKPLNAKQLRSDRGNGISIAANRFGCCTEAWCSIPTSMLTWARTVCVCISLRPSSACRKFSAFVFKLAHASKDTALIAESLKSVYFPELQKKILYFVVSCDSHPSGAPRRLKTSWEQCAKAAVLMDE